MITALAQITVSNGTGVTIGIAIPMAMGLAWLLGKFSSLESRVRSHAKRLEEVWMQSDQKVWAQDLDNANDTLKVPDPYAVIRERRQRERNGH
jgi:hypothetical protein